MGRQNETVVLYQYQVQYGSDAIWRPFSFPFWTRWTSLPELQYESHEAVARPDKVYYLLHEWLRSNDSNFWFKCEGHPVECCHLLFLAHDLKCETLRNLAMEVLRKVRIEKIEVFGDCLEAYFGECATDQRGVVCRLLKGFFETRGEERED
jgi:hypothetical protein